MSKPLKDAVGIHISFITGEIERLEETISKQEKIIKSYEHNYTRLNALSLALDSLKDEVENSDTPDAVTPIDY